MTMPSQLAPPKAESREVPGSVAILVAANLVPLYGVVFLRWQVFPLMVLFWLENVIIGFFTVLKMVVADPAPGAGCLVKPFLIGFFMFHYGGFASGHLVFVLTLFGGFWQKGLADGAAVRTVADLQIGWAVLALVLSHAISFGLNYMGKGEYKTANVGALMFQPYGRVVVLHLSLLAGGFVIVLLDSPVFAVALLVVLKILLDVTAHVREHDTAMASATRIARPSIGRGQDGL